MLFLVFVFVALPILALQYLVLPELISLRTQDMRAEAIANNLANGN